MILHFHFRAYLYLYLVVWIPFSICFLFPFPFLAILTQYLFDIATVSLIAIFFSSLNLSSVHNYQYFWLFFLFPWDSIAFTLHLLHYLIHITGTTDITISIHYIHSIFGTNPISFATSFPSSLLAIIIPLCFYTYSHALTFSSFPHIFSRWGY